MEGPSTRSLKDLCAKKAVEHISDLSPSEFETLEPRLQRMLFSAIQAEIQRLREEVEDWHTFKQFCPRLDASVFLESARIRRKGLTLSATMSQGYYYSPDLRVELQRKWPRFVEGRPVETYIQGEARWSHCTLTLDSKDSMFRCQNDTDIYERQFSGSITTRIEIELWRRISPQLLLSRIVAVFEMPTSSLSTEGQSCTWRVSLGHSDYNSTIEFSDKYGSPSVEFRGSQDASRDGLRLLNLLVDPEFPKKP